MKFQDLVWTKSRDSEELKHSCRDFLAQLLKAWMGAGPVKLRHDICDGVADARDRGESASRDEAAKRLRERAETVGRAQVSFRAMCVARTPSKDWLRFAGRSWP